MNLREAESRSIRDFVAHAAEGGYLSGRVLDFGSGQQPYRLLVEANGGEYLPFDRKCFPANLSGEDVGMDAYGGALGNLDAILCTQVLQYVPYPRDILWHWRSALRDPLGHPKGHIVVTYPTNWPEVETEDLHRFTKAGMERMLSDTGFTVVEHVWRHGVEVGGVSYACGYGVIASA